MELLSLFSISSCFPSPLSDVCGNHYSDVIMDTIASQITSLTIVYSTVYSDADQGKHQSSASLAFVRGIHRGPVNYPHKWPVTRKMFPFDDVIMIPVRTWQFLFKRCNWTLSHDFRRVHLFDHVFQVHVFIYSFIKQPRLYPVVKCSCSTICFTFLTVAIISKCSYNAYNSTCNCRSVHWQIRL